MKRHLIAAVLTAVGLNGLSIAGAQAASVTFGNFFSDNSEFVKTDLTANDNTAGRITVSINIAADSLQTGVLTGVFVDFAALSEGALAISVPGINSIVGFDNNTTNIGSGVNLNGATSDPFDFAFRFDKNDSSGNVLSNDGIAIDQSPFDPFVFSFADNGFGLSDLTRIGLRFQSVSGQNETSDKVIGTPVAAVPLPAALPLMASIVCAAGFVGWRKRRA